MSEHDQEISFGTGDAWTRAIARHRETALCHLFHGSAHYCDRQPRTGSGVIDARGLPGYTFECASGELCAPASMRRAT